MQAIGMIETKGLLAAIESADSMTKSANVQILEKVYVGGGLVTIIVNGDVGAVRAAVDAGVAAVKTLGEEFLISEHIIPRPHEDLKAIMEFGQKKEEIKENITDVEVKEQILEKEIVVEKIEETESENEIFSDSLEADSQVENLEIVEEEKIEIAIEEKKFTRKDIEEYLRENKKEEIISELNILKISELRKLLKEYQELNLSNRTISKLNKENLINRILEFYNLRGEE
jgi:microcompartment protein CcmL/EutN